MKYPQKYTLDVIKELYIKWLATPRIEGVAPEDIKDETLRDILTINSRKEFADKYKVTLQQLTTWAKSTEAKAESKKWKDVFRKFTPMVTAKLLNGIIQEGDAARIKVWYQHVEDENESENAVNFNFGDIIKNIRDDENGNANNTSPDKSDK